MTDHESKCCISGCTNDEEYSLPDTNFYRFPNGDDPVGAIQRSMWIEAIQNGSFNGPMWHPSESSVLCSDHFLHIKDHTDPSFIPSLFPAKRTDAELQRPVVEKDQSCDSSMLQKLVDQLPKSLGGQPGADAAQLRETFRELACQVCRVLVAHDSELRIEGTVGVTVDGGPQVMLLHFADQLRKVDNADLEEGASNPASEHSTDSARLFKEENLETAKNDTWCIPFNRNYSSDRLMEGNSSAVGSMDNSMKMSQFTASTSQCATSSARLLSQLAQQTASMMPPNSPVQNTGTDMARHKRKSEPSNSASSDKSRQTLLRELLCAPIPPKRPCRPTASSCAVAGSNSVIGEISRQPHRPTANSTVLGGLLRTGTYQHDPVNYPAVSTYIRNVQPRHEPWTGAQGANSTQRRGSDVPRPECDSTAVRALLRFASKHAASSQHDLFHGSNPQGASTSSVGEGSVNDASEDEKLVDRRFSLLYQNLICSNPGRTSSGSFSASDKSAGSHSGTTNDGSPAVDSATVKQEVLDPSYE